MTYSDEQRKAAESTKKHFNSLLREKGRSEVVTEITPAPEYFIAEDYRTLHANARDSGKGGF